MSFEELMLFYAVESWQEQWLLWRSLSWTDIPAGLEQQLEEEKEEHAGFMPFGRWLDVGDVS